MWGVAIRNQSNDRLFITQKHCIRILFGDLDAYLNKQSTCARARPYGMQKLGQCYYEREHTKPIFNKLKIMSIQNLFKYHCITEFFKIIKFRQPYTLFECINLSKRDTSHTVILAKKTNNFLHEAAKLWNTTYKHILTPNKGLETSLNSIKLRIRTIILQIQSADLRDTWTSNNFSI